MTWMRAKQDYDRDMPAERAEPTKAVAPSRAPQTERGSNVNIGPSIHVQGTLSGKEDLTIDGKVEGKICLKGHVLTIGANGLIQADLAAKTVIIHGKVSGNVSAKDKVEVAATGSVQGDINAPRVSIIDGAQFRGKIDMERGAGQSAAKEAAVKATAIPAVQQPSQRADGRHHPDRRGP